MLTPNNTKFIKSKKINLVSHDSKVIFLLMLSKIKITSLVFIAQLRSN